MIFNLYRLWTEKFELGWIRGADSTGTVRCATWPDYA